VYDHGRGRGPDLLRRSPGYRMDAVIKDAVV